MRFIITKDKATYESLCNQQVPLLSTLGEHTESPTWFFLNQLNFTSNNVEDLKFCLSDTLFF